MERNRPYYSLSKIKKWIKEGSYIITRQAVIGARAFGIINEERLLSVILQVQRKDFYKSMESHNLPGTWQDVYRPLISGKRAYIKLQIIRNTKTVVIQFKEMNSW